MTILNETITLNRPAHEVFAYVSDFANCQQWDATATRSERLDDGPLGVGSRFDVNCALPVGSLDLIYEVTEFQAPHKIVLVGRGRFFEVTDTITVTPDKVKGKGKGESCSLEYTAEFDWKPYLSGLAQHAQAGLERMGHESVQVGLKEALDDNYSAPAPSRSLGWFTRRGYRQGSKAWQPVSAYMGDKHVVLTGATAGLGLACAHQLASTGAQVTLVVRDKERGKKLVTTLINASGNTNIRLEVADLSLMKDVDKLVKRLLKQDRPIDVLINNAGALFNDRETTSEDLERSFALLLLSPYRLTEGLLPLLKQANTARVINVVSGGMYTQKLRVDDLQNEQGKYAGPVAYARCKRALMIKTEQWAQEWAEHGITVNAMHPGWADTPGVESSLPVFYTLTRPLLRTPDEGADTMTWMATATEAGSQSGLLLLDRLPRRTHLTGSTRETEADRIALQRELRAML